MQSVYFRNSAYLAVKGMVAMFEMRRKSRGSTVGRWFVEGLFLLYRVDKRKIGEVEEEQVRYIQEHKLLHQHENSALQHMSRVGTCHEPSSLPTNMRHRAAVKARFAHMSLALP